MLALVCEGVRVLVRDSSKEMEQGIVRLLEGVSDGMLVC